jgi:hypothetical protein
VRSGEAVSLVKAALFETAQKHFPMRAVVVLLALDISRPFDAERIAGEEYRR